MQKICRMGAVFKIGVVGSRCEDETPWGLAKIVALGPAGLGLAAAGVHALVPQVPQEKLHFGRAVRVVAPVNTFTEGVHPALQGVCVKMRDHGALDAEGVADDVHVCP